MNYLWRNTTFTDSLGLELEIVTTGMQRGLVVLSFMMMLQAAVLPPPWADPVHNPCAAQPGGWQLLYWPADGQCYKIFHKGHPCPETMEMAPGPEGMAECACPPSTAQYSKDAKCHELFTRGPCPKGQYFAPFTGTKTKPHSIGTQRQWGICRDPDPCPESDHVFWAKDERCYPEFKKGPCPKGQLLLSVDGLGLCSCEANGVLAKYYWLPTNTCHEHYTKGPCAQPGTLFLPEGQCGCHDNLPHHSPQDGLCYEIGGIGPCLPGHRFVIPNDGISTHAVCKCKDQHILWQEDGSCYRLYTRGPCASGEFLFNSTTCMPVPCHPGRLYFPEEATCYKVGTQGPCLPGQIVLFENSVKTSVDGISYRGICGCPSNTDQSQCHNQESQKSCEKPGMVRRNGACYALYTKGPCSRGQWLVPLREPRQWTDTSVQNKHSRVTCECRPGYKYIKIQTTNSVGNLQFTEQCQPQAVTLAQFLNQRHYPV